MCSSPRTPRVRARAGSPTTPPAGRSSPRTPRVRARADSPATPPAGRRTPLLEPNAPEHFIKNFKAALRRDNPSSLKEILLRDALAAVVPISSVSSTEAPETPLVKALRWGCSDTVIQMLLDHGASADEPACSADSPPLVVLATLEPGPEIPRFFGMDVSDHQSGLARTGPLDDEDRLMTIARCLLGAGADPDRLDAQGRTAADHADASGRLRLGSLLRNARGRATCKILRAMWSRPALPGRFTCSFLELPEVPQQHISSFLAS
eukprot:TRINITY_DN1095_c0_g1_i1.p1 TRINITY_DN1095_c0_g1~~TRINITY_DN1095_c0_g1_i1.p1  ORF type:complete len:264 (+),score=26.94 TRINITY_DN1095_c0_g1_i1:162-953(+)